LDQKSTIRIHKALEERIRAHGQQTYPNECCGALLGRDSGSPATQREITEILPLKNQHQDSPRNRFILTPDDVREAEAHSKRTGVELLGWYHSHPEAPARPSEFDREHAWPWYSYVIVSVKAGHADEMNSWRLLEDRSGYDSEKIEIDDRAEAIKSIS
jgi:proteasome lid subunit RPN8/RPN11